MKTGIMLAAVVALISSPAIGQKRPPARPAAKPAPKAAPVAPKPPAAPPVLYAFKGVPLETSLDDFRKMPHPDGTASKVICTGEKPGLDKYETSPADTGIYDEIERSVGVTKCVWVETQSKYLNGWEAGLSLAGTSYGTTSYSFSFIKDPKDGVMRLFEFNGTANMAVFDDTVQALTGKWGKPVTTTGTVQNKMGNSFDQTTAIWMNPLASITAQTRFTKIDDMGIIVMDARLEKIVSDARAAKKAATPNAI